MKFEFAIKFYAYAVKNEPPGPEWTSGLGFWGWGRLLFGGFGFHFGGHGEDELFHGFAEVFGFGHGGSFAVDAEDGLGVGLAQVYPAVGKVDFDAVDVGDFLLGVFCLDGFEEGVDVGVGCELYLCFGDGILGIGLLEFADFCRSWQGG